MKYFVWCCIFFLLGTFSSKVYAYGEQIRINEIMYDAEGTDTDHEWIEIHNVSASPISLNGWKIHDGSNHTLNEPPINGGQGSLLIPAGGFIVITGDGATFLADHTGFTGTVIDSVLSLSNTGDTIKIIDQSGVVFDQVTYSSNLGAAGDGNGLSFYQSGWIVATPTPGTQNQSSSQSTNTSNSTTLQTSSSIKPVVFTDSQKERVWDLEIIPSTQSVFTNVPFTVTAKVLDLDKRQRNIGKFVYNFGDGTKGIYLKNDPVPVAYTSSGSYIIYLEFYDAPTDPHPTVIERLLITVEDTPIVISRDEKDVRKIILSNLHPLDIDLSNWKLVDGINEFIFPPRSFLPGKKHVVINPTVHSLGTGHVVLETPNHEMVATYPSGISHVNTLPATTKTVGESAYLENTFIDGPLSVDTKIDKTTHLSKETKNTNSTGTRRSIHFWTAFFLVFMSITGLLFFMQQQKK